MLLAALALACGGKMVEGTPVVEEPDARGYLVTGTVTSGGTGAASVAVALTGTGRSASTDASGRFQFAGVAPGKYTLAPAKEGMVPTPSSLEVEVVDRDALDVAFRLEPRAAAGATSFSISGAVGVAAGTLPSVTLALGGGAVRTVEADASGRFSFAGLPAGSYTVTPSSPNRRFHPVSQTFVLEADATGVAFTLVPAFKLAGKVSAAGAGVAEAVVSIAGSATLTATTDAAGAFAVEGLEAGTYRLSAARQGYRAADAAPVEVAVTGDVTGVALALVRTHAISGAVSAAGVGLPGVAVALTGGAVHRTASAGAGGAFIFEGLDDGTYQLTPSFPGYSFDPPTAPVTLAGADASGVVFAAGRSASGVVAGVDAAGMEVVATPVAGGAARRTTTDGAGAFAFTGLAAGDWDVAPVARAGLSVSPASRRISVAGAHLTGLAFASGYAITGNAGRQGGVTVSLTGAGGFGLGTTTDAAGAFAFAGLPAGAYTVAVSKAGVDLQPPSRLVTIGTASAALPDFQVAHAISGTVRGVPSGKAATVTVRTTAGLTEATVSTDASGNFRVPHLVDGQHVVAAALSGYDLSPSSTQVSLVGGRRQRGVHDQLLHRRRPHLQRVRLAHHHRESGRAPQRAGNRQRDHLRVALRVLRRTRARQRQLHPPGSRSRTFP